MIASRRVIVGKLDMIRSNRQGKEETFPVVWAVGRDQSNEALVIAEGASKGTIFRLHFSEAQVQRMLEAIEIEKDVLRAEHYEKWGR